MRIILFQGIIGIGFGGGLVWQSLQDTIRIGSRGFAVGDEFPNPTWFRIPLGICGSVILAVSVWKLWLLWR